MPQAVTSWWALTPGFARICAGLALVCSVCGCHDACASLAERTCARAGQKSELCRKLQAVAAAPTGADLEACKAGNAFAEELEKR